MPHAGQELTNTGGYSLRLVRTGAETGGELLEMEARYAQAGMMPPEHLHPTQDERFEVLEGAVRTVIGGEERVYGAGERFEVPAGTPHRMGTDGPARLRWEVRPAQRTAEFFERLYGDGPDSARNAASPEEFLAEFAAEIRMVG
jgi:quercetin dioxygenase-like cupin family protein